MVLDLKDTFFSLPLASKSQDLFAFEWHNPELGINRQLIWTGMLQGSENPLNIFDEALHKDLSEYRTQYPNLTPLQYVDDLLVAAETKQECPKELLEVGENLGY